MPKIVTARREGTRRSGKPRRRWIDEVEED
jgi:hypothetical protein